MLEAVKSKHRCLRTGALICTALAAVAAGSAMAQPPQDGAHHPGGPGDALRGPMASVMEAPPATHCDEPHASPVLTQNVRYTGAEPPRCSVNHHGEIEELPGGVQATHWFVAADGVTWHLVTAGDPANEAVVFLHGLPESWYAFHNQMSALSDVYYTISIDQMGYGQSDKRLDLDFSPPAQALKLEALLDTLRVETFNIVAHDRGAVTADHLAAVDGMSERMLKYVRMQQSGSEPHGEPRPPHHLFASEMGVQLFKRDGMVRRVYSMESGYSSIDIEQAELDRAIYEFTYEGVAEAVSAYFQTTDFDRELDDRLNAGLFDAMSMPVLFLQGALDPGQHREEYDHVTDFVADGSVIFIENASHFPHMERPDQVTSIIRDSLAEH